MVNVDLAYIAARLEGLEETIILRLIDRAQFRRNEAAYAAGRSGFDGEPERSLFDIRLSYQETMDSLFGRFKVPEERPFTAGLPEPRRIVVLPPTCLMIGDYNLVNLSGDILGRYIRFLPSLCEDGDDGQYGSSTELDVYSVQAVARRIHFGAMYVAESKYRVQPALFRKYIREGDEKALLELLTRPEVEDRIIARVREKTAYLQERVNRSVRTVIEPETVAGLYESTVIPLTKRGEILYLLHRQADSV